MAELTACYALARPPPPPPHAGDACGLPPELWTAIAESLGARELASLAAASSALDAIAVPIVPGLSCRLYPHQCATVRWMLRRERAGLAGVQQSAGPPAIAPSLRLRRRWQGLGSRRSRLSPDLNELLLRALEDRLHGFLIGSPFDVTS